ncbi:hypothetical protein MRX96_051479 [Rhipicephalus microplus]
MPTVSTCAIATGRRTRVLLSAVERRPRNRSGRPRRDWRTCFSVLRRRGRFTGLGSTSYSRRGSSWRVNRRTFFTDASDPLYQLKTNGHLINTNCSSSHNRKALCCKMSVELDFFLDSNKKWMCHFDDDNYVNVPRLVKLLQEYDPREDWYLGKPSIRQPLEILARDSTKPQRKIAFWFATGGAGFCISRSLALKMLPLAG